MARRTWFVTGVNSGFGRELAEQILEKGDRLVGTVRDGRKVADLVERYPQTFQAEILDVTDPGAIRRVIERAFSRLGRIDVLSGRPGGGTFRDRGDDCRARRRTH